MQSSVASDAEAEDCPLSSFSNRSLRLNARMPIKTTRKLLLSQPTVATALIIAFALAVGTALLATLSTRAITSANERAYETQKTLVAINRLLGTINEAETGQRGYILTRDEKYLLPYETARARLPAEFATLRLQYGERSDKVTELRDLLKLTEDKLNELSYALTLLRERGMAPALNYVESDKGWVLMDQIRQLMTTLQNQEISEMTLSSSAAETRAKDVQKLNLGLIGLAVILAAAAGLFLIRRMHDLETLITVCSWTRRVKWQNRWMSFEEYLNTRFNLTFTHGISEEAAEQFRQQLEAEPMPDEGGSSRDGLQR
jgi:CHASE3 domain sensor protein